MIAGGVAAVVVFKGFAAAILEDVRWGAVNSQFGHIQVANTKLWNPDKDDLTQDRQLQGSDKIKTDIAQVPGVDTVSARQFSYGLVSTGDHSVAAQIVGYEPGLEKEMLGPDVVIKGTGFSKPSRDGEVVFEAAVGEGLARLLRVEPGQSLTLIAQTVDGAINAADAEVKVIFRTLIQEVDDTTVYIPLELSQRLLDSSSVERIIIKLKDHGMVEGALARIKALMPEGIQARNWREFARLYNQTEEYFDTQNSVIAGIIVILILLSITSTVSISVAERTGEVGTVRALGDSKSVVMKQFAVEGILMGVIGGILGVFLGVLLSQALNLAALPITLPGATQPVTVRIVFLFAAYVQALGLTILATFIATLLAARRVVGLPIVEALKNNV